ncbi:MAG: serine/threonine protein kinase, partial [Usitatibacter sp.]
MNDPHPYSRLIPDTVLNSLESVGLLCDGRLLALNSYENRVYQVGLDDGSLVVAKFYRPARWSDAQILEEHGFARELAEAEIPVVAPSELAGTTLHHAEGFAFAVFPRRGGRSPELDDPETLEWLGRFIGRIHAVGATKPYAHRPALDIASFGEEPRAFLLASGLIPVDLLPAWTQASALALEGVRHAFARTGEVAMIRTHGDCHASNVLWTPDSGNSRGGPHFVDLDDSRMAPAVQDLWMLVSGDRHAMGRQLGKLLRGYEDFMEFDDRELQLVEALRTLRLLHYSAWIARRWDDPAFPIAFPWFNTSRYWQDRVLELREQIAA